MILERNRDARIVAEFPREVVEIEHVWIPMPDGARLSARIWMPEDAERDPVPAILEYIPYRKRDGTRIWDDPRHRYWAGHGYACVRLDIRGTGESEGLIADEYAEREQDDAVEAIAWIARQAWCTGKVGMTGISWGGFNSLQVAARRPPALKAIVTHCSTDDRYADDVHFMGGCLLLDNFFWGSAFFMLMARPGDPLIQGEGWRQQWMERLENWEPVAATVWQRRQQRDAYWKHGSVCESYADIECAVYAVGGWNDGYSNAVPRLLANLSCPRKGLVGPWGHKYPHDAIPGPSIGFLQEGLRWWDHWLKDEDTGIMAEPRYRVWLDEPQTPRAVLPESKGRWVTEPDWPAPDIAGRTLHLNADGLGDEAAGERVLTHRSPETVGAGGGVWCPYGLGGSSPDLPVDQREDDAKSLCFDGAPLESRLEILGAPEVVLRLAIDKPQGMVVARLNDVAPDGASARVTYGMLNLSQRDDWEHTEAMTPGEEVEVRVRLNDCAHAFPAGHRLRIALSTSYFPVAWTAPEPFALSLRTGASTLALRCARRGTRTAGSRLPAARDGARAGDDGRRAGRGVAPHRARRRRPASRSRASSRTAASSGWNRSTWSARTAATPSSASSTAILCRRARHGAGGAGGVGATGTSRSGSRWTCRSRRRPTASPAIWRLSSTTGACSPAAGPTTCRATTFEETTMSDETALIVGVAATALERVAGAVVPRRGHDPGLGRARHGQARRPSRRDTAARTYACDAADRADVASLFESLDRDGLTPDLAVYNPSFRVRGPFVELDREAVARTLAVTAYGAFLMGQHAASRMLKAGGGTILFTGASAGVKGYPQSAPFAMGKFALRGLAQSMARELHPRNIHVGHVVIDGGIGESVDDARLHPDAIAQSYLHLHRQHRSAWAWEIELRPFVETF